MTTVAEPAADAGSDISTAEAAPAAGPAPIVERLGLLGGYDAKKCSVILQRDILDDPDLKDPYDDATLALFAGGIAFEDEVTEMLRDALTESGLIGSCAFIVEERDAAGERTVEGKEKKVSDTLAAMNDGALVIVNGRLRDLDGLRILEPDVLVRAGDAPKANGKWAYWPVDVKMHKIGSGTTEKTYPVSSMGRPFLDTTVTETFVGRPKFEDDMQLAHYFRGLQSLGFEVEGDQVWGAIIGKELQLVWRRLDIEDNRRWDRQAETMRKFSVLDFYDQEFCHRIEVKKRALEHADDPSLPLLEGPQWKDECKSCTWRTLCHDQLVESQHITLLPGITPDRARPHYARGITTHPQLARLHSTTARVVDAGLDAVALIEAAKDHLNAEDSVEVLFSGRDVASKAPKLIEAGCSTVGDVLALDRRTASYGKSGVWQLARSIDVARAKLTNKAYRVRGLDAPSMPRCRFDAGVEIDIDFETTGSIGGGPDFVYLIGCKTTGFTKKGTTAKTRTENQAFADWSGDPAGEAKVFAEFWAYFTFMLQKAKLDGFSIRLYHYTAFERHNFVKMAERNAGQPGVPTREELDLILKSLVDADGNVVDGREVSDEEYEQAAEGDKLFVDMYPILSKEIVWPTESHSIKSLAKFTGFTWDSGSEANGANSTAWFREATDPALSADERTANQERLVRYVTDDVTGQLELRDWVTMLQRSRKAADRLACLDSLDVRFDPRPRLTRTA